MKGKHFVFLAAPVLAGLLTSLANGQDRTNEAARPTIAPNSVVLVTVRDNPGLSGHYPIDGVGVLRLAYLGPIMIGNVTEKEAEERIADALKSRKITPAIVRVELVNRGSALEQGKIRSQWKD